MLSNNAERFQLWLELEKTTHFSKFNEECIKRNIPEFGIVEFATKVGMLVCAESEYPEIELTSAYIKLATTPTVVKNSVKPENSLVKHNCGTCGGGKVR